MKIWELKLSGNLRATPGLLRDCFTFLYQNARFGKRQVRLLYCYAPLLLCDGIAAHIYAGLDNRTSNWNIFHCRDLRHDRRGTGSPSTVERWKRFACKTDQRRYSDGTAVAHRSPYALFRVL